MITFRDNPVYCPNDLDLGDEDSQRFLDHFSPEWFIRSRTIEVSNPENFQLKVASTTSLCQVKDLVSQEDASEVMTVVRQLYGRLGEGEHFVLSRSGDLMIFEQICINVPENERYAPNEDMPHNPFLVQNSEGEYEIPLDLFQFILTHAP